jgi:serine-type D-Ala-D-Ala carboxypeptidase (penicillin-binding protein 5/6)
MRNVVVTVAAVASAAFFACSAPAFAAPPPDLQVTGASLFVAGAPQPLWSENGDAELAIASTTKLMTALVVLRQVTDLNEVFGQGPWLDQPGDSQIGLVPGERMTVRDLLVALLLPSADDAAEDLAYNVGHGSVARFVAMMNVEARRLGLDHTHYATPSGLDTPGNYSSPDDLVRLADYDMSHFAFFRHTVALRSASITVGRSPMTVTNTDTLLGAVPWIHGIKTGHTLDAGYVLVSEGTRDGFTLTASVLGTDSEAARNANALALLDYGFGAYHLIRPLRAGAALASLPVAYSSTRASVVIARTFADVVADSADVVLRRKLPKQLSGPIAAGAVLGHVRVLVSGRVVADVPLLLRRALPAVSTITKVSQALGGPFTLIFALLALAAAVVFKTWRRYPRVSAAGHSRQR